MHGFLCNAENDQLVLNEHIDFKWLSIQELDQLDWAAADIPFVNKLKQLA
jgi:8-oxo-dGTP diphosphatase